MFGINYDYGIIVKLECPCYGGFFVKTDGDGNVLSKCSDTCKHKDKIDVEKHMCDEFKKVNLALPHTKMDGGA